MLAPTSEALKKAIRAEEHPELMKLLGSEFHRVEALMKQCPPNHPERPKLTRAMTAFAGQLNRMIAKACLELAYPLEQWEWKDSAPLGAVADAYPMLGLEGTDWYQRHLSLVLMEPAERHPWWELQPHATAISTSAARGAADAKANRADKRDSARENPEDETGRGPHTAYSVIDRAKLHEEERTNGVDKANPANLLVIQAIEGYEGAIRTLPASVSRCYFQGLEPFLSGVAERHIDTSGVSLEGDLALNRLVFCSSFIGAWYLVNGDRPRSIQTAQACFMHFAAAGCDHQMIESVVMPGYAHLENVHCEAVKSKGVGGPLASRRLAVVVAALVVIVIVYLLAR